jgi:hypothetical protein
VTARIPMTSDTAMVAILQIQPNGKQVLLINGEDDEYAGFSLSCGLPPKAVVVDLQPPFRRPLTKLARLLFAECMTMPNAVNGANFR